MRDIVDLIMADHSRIKELFGELEDAGRLTDESGTGRLGEIWTPLAALLALHVDAAEEISRMAILRGAVDGQMAEIVADDDDIREALGEARFHPPGSRLWWLAVRAARVASIRHIEAIESGPLPAFRRHASARKRELLGAQWLAFTAARAADMDPLGPSMTSIGPLAEHRTGGTHAGPFGRNLCRISTNFAGPGSTVQRACRHGPGRAQAGRPCRPPSAPRTARRRPGDLTLAEHREHHGRIGGCQRRTQQQGHPPAETEQVVRGETRATSSPPSTASRRPTHKR